MHSPSHLENLRVVLVSPRNPLNIGAAARAMSNFGAPTLRIVTPYEPAFREARSAVGAEDLMARAEIFSNVAAAVADCALVVGTAAAGRRGPVLRLLSLLEGAAIIQPALPGGAVAVLFGSEKRGLTNEDLAHCHWAMNIPTEAQQPSMNLGQAVAVCLYELAREPRVEAATPPQPEPAAAAQLERLTTVLLECLDSSGYILPEQRSVTEQNVRRLIRRLNPERENAELLLGMLRQMLWKLRSEAKTETD